MNPCDETWPRKLAWRRIFGTESRLVRSLRTVAASFLFVVSLACGTEERSVADADIFGDLDAGQQGPGDASGEGAATDASQDATQDATREPDAVASESGVDAAVDAPASDASDAPVETLRVIFVGNSYTYQNDLPGWVERLAESAGTKRIETDARTAGGAMLQDHWSNADTVSAISDGTWDFVVLQGQSVEPIAAPSGFQQHALLLAEAASTAGAVPVFFETWARAVGHEVYDEPWSGGTPAAMQEGLRNAYTQAANDAGGVLAPVGDAWETVLAQHPGIQLHGGDGSHPTEHGTYLAACVFYGTLAGLPSQGITERPSSVSDAEAEILQTVADAQVFGE